MPAILEEPLKPGAYQIVLRSTSPDNVVAMSVETAVVSIPETKDGQVLALVEEPGKPSEMIIVPKPEAPSGDLATAAPQAAEAPAAQAPVTEAQPAATPTAEAPAAAPEPGKQVAALPAEPEKLEVPAAPAKPAASGPSILVEAVEIDGRKIFVAGIADAGRRVRGYANDILLGDATAAPDGHYLIEAERDLPVGDYIIRVDALEADGVKVAARAAVPFEREPGETIAAVAPQAPPAPTAVPPAAPVAAPPPVADETAPAGSQADQAPAVAAPADIAQAPATETPASVPPAGATAEQPSRRASAGRIGGSGCARKARRARPKHPRRPRRRLPSRLRALPRRRSRSHPMPRL